MLVPPHALVIPEIDEGEEGADWTLTDKLLWPLPPQELLALTSTLPDVLPQLTVIEVLPFPEVILAPEGTLQE